LYKLPSSQFSKLSERHLKRGSYTADGDAGKTLHWDQNFRSRRLTKDCPLCELIGTAWEGSPNDPGDVGSIEATDMEFTIQFRFRQETDEARLDISVQEIAGEPKRLSLKMYHEWKKGELSFLALDNIPKLTMIRILKGTRKLATQSTREPQWLRRSSLRLLPWADALHR
jgi:hypothetical protein